MAEFAAGEFTLRNIAAISWSALSDCLSGPFMSAFDGIQIGADRAIEIWESTATTIMALVDGNVVRNVQEASSTEEVQFPKFVAEALEKYTTMAGRAFPTDAKKWLQENLAPTWGSKALYRGFSIEDIDTLEEATKALKAYTGLTDLAQVRKGASIVLNRKRASSWSSTPQVATGFTEQAFGCGLGIVAKASVRPEQVIIDFQQLPISQRKDFPYFSQNEVVLAAGKVPAAIAGLNINSVILEKLQKWGYSYSQAKGIYKV